MDRHNQSFFGQKTALLFDSGSASDPFCYFRCIRKTESGWEKPSENGGKAVKLSLQELICVCDVLAGVRETWSTVHKFNSESTSLSFQCENRTEMKFKFTASQSPNSYLKPLLYPESKVLLLLLQHVIQEKIELSTGYSGKNAEPPSEEIPTPKVQPQKQPEPPSVQSQPIPQESPKVQPKKQQDPPTVQPPSLDVKVEKSQSEDQTEIAASVKRITAKAVLLELQPGDEIWVPKSAILNGNYHTEGVLGTFALKSWVLKNKATA